MENDNTLYFDNSLSGKEKENVDYVVDGSLFNGRLVDDTRFVLSKNNNSF